MFLPGGAFVMSEAMDTSRVRCPNCRTKYRVPRSYIGKKVRCARCETLFRVGKDRRKREDVSFWQAAVVEVKQRYGDYDEFDRRAAAAQVIADAGLSSSGAMDLTADDAEPSPSLEATAIDESPDDQADAGSSDAALRLEDIDRQ